MDIDLSWMACTRPTANFFIAIALMLLAMTAWQLLAPSIERVGILGIPTTRGDRVFITLLGTAFINLAWLGIIGDGQWWALAVSAAFALAVFRWV
jgi:predicted small integral membrane protein